MTTWNFFQNPFLNATEGNYKLMLDQGTYHVNALTAHTSDSFINGLLTATGGLFTTFESKYTAWKATGGGQKTKTLTLDQLLAQATTKLNLWEPAILVVYPKTTPQYQSFFPQGRRPFTNGSKDSRIAAFETLDTTLTGIVALATTKTAVHAYWQSLHDARQQQQGAFSNTDDASTQVEAARVALATQMYGNLGSMIGHTPATPTNYDIYFDLAGLRNHEQTVFTGHLAALGTHEVVKHKFDPTTDHIKVTATGINCTMQAYFTNGISVEPAAGQPVIAVAPNTFIIATPAAMGYADDKRHLCIKCAGPADGDWEVELV